MLQGQGVEETKFPSMKQLDWNKDSHSFCPSHGFALWQTELGGGASSSQLQGGDVEVNSAARERTPNLMFKNTGLRTCSSVLRLRAPLHSLFQLHWQNL